MTASYPSCPGCGAPLELYDTMDANPPIPYSAWPRRWRVTDGDGGIRVSCVECGEDLDGMEVAEAAGLPDYPWKSEAA